MTAKPTYVDLERRIKQLELEILEYQLKDKVLNEDLSREIKTRKHVEKELKQVSHRLGERIAKFIEREWAEDEIRKHRDRDE